LIGFVSTSFQKEKAAGIAKKLEQADAWCRECLVRLKPSELTSQRYMFYRTYAASETVLEEITRAGIPPSQATGAKAVDEEPPLNALKAVLETIQERAKYALERLRTFEEPKSLAWQCVNLPTMKRIERQNAEHKEASCLARPSPPIRTTALF